MTEWLCTSVWQLEGPPEERRGMVRTYSHPLRLHVPKTLFRKGFYGFNHFRSGQRTACVCVCVCVCVSICVSCMPMSGRTNALSSHSENRAVLPGGSARVRIHRRLRLEQRVCVWMVPVASIPVMHVHTRSTSGGARERWACGALS